MRAAPSAQCLAAALRPHRHYRVSVAAKLRRKLRTFGGLSAFSLLWLLPIWAMIGLASLAIKLVPLRRLGPVLGVNLGAVGLVPLADVNEQKRARQFGQAISVAARYAPFRSNCYPQAIVAVLLCRLYRIPYAMQFGATFEGEPGSAERKLKAHAWVVSGRVAICGQNSSFGAFGVVGCFVAKSVARSRAGATSRRP